MIIFVDICVSRLQENIRLNAAASEALEGRREALEGRREVLEGIKDSRDAPEGSRTK